MARDKRKQIKMLYELEKLTEKEDPTDYDKYCIEYYRKELGVERQVNEAQFKLDKYLKLVKDMPEITDTQRAKIMGITKSQLGRGKRKYKIVGMRMDELLKMA